jgi:hypothetical protein
MNKLINMLVPLSAPLFVVVVEYYLSQTMFRVEMS